MSNSSNVLTKTDFKLARECPTKLYYSRKGYKSKNESSDYMELLKEGGFIIGEMARIVHPQGIYIGLEEGDETAVEKTKQELKKDKIMLFEAVVVHSGMLVVADILEKNGNNLNLIEVKSKSYDSNEENSIIGKTGKIKAEWQEYIEDVAFQALVLKGAYPELDVTPYLMLPDKSITTKIDLLASFFHIEKYLKKGVERYKVNFTGNREALISDNFLRKVNVAEATAFLMPLVKQEANRFVEMINPTLTKTQYHLGKHCKDCEFKRDDGELSGYHECWGELADVKPHIFDLYFGGALKKDGKFLYDEMISQKKVSLYDIPEDAIKAKRGERQAVQISYTKQNKEWINPIFRHEIESYAYPLHFMDFETSTSAIPYHKDMRPYESIAFQWSCHTINSPGAEPIHNEWINLEDSFPSFKFAESLMKVISPNGTIFMWAKHENSVLKDIRRQMLEYGYDNNELAQWIESVVATKESKGRLVDMNEQCRENYFHPYMKGKTSIKYVLPAIWNNNSYLWDVEFLKKYHKVADTGEILTPYAMLPGININGKTQSVKEGTGAMIAYQEMMYGLSRDDKLTKTQWSKLLLQYCELDTLAMIIIYMHWCRLLNIKY